MRDKVIAFVKTIYSTSFFVTCMMALVYTGSINAGEAGQPAVTYVGISLVIPLFGVILLPAFFSVHRQTGT